MDGRRLKQLEEVLRECERPSLRTLEDEGALLRTLESELRAYLAGERIDPASREDEGGVDEPLLDCGVPRF